MLTPKQIMIFGIFLKNPYKSHTFKEIKAHGKENSNSTIQLAIAKFLKEDLITKARVGNVITYTLNRGNNLALGYIAVLTQHLLSQSALRSLRTINSELQEVDFISVAIFGSYAEGTQTEESDLDIAIFASSAEDKRKSERALKSAELKTVLNIDYHVFTKEELLHMLKDKHENLGKQIARKHIVVQNPAIFYGILEKGVQNGFRVVPV